MEHPATSTQPHVPKSATRRNGPYVFPVTTPPAPPSDGNTAVILRAKPIDVRAHEFTGDIHAANLAMLGRRAYGNAPCLRAHPGDQAYPAVHTKADVVAEVWNAADFQWQPVAVGDWILQGVDGAFYAAPAEVIDRKYDVLPAPADDAQ